MFERQKSLDLRSCLQWKSERDGWVFKNGSQEQPKPRATDPENEDNGKKGSSEKVKEQILLQKKLVEEKTKAEMEKLKGELAQSSTENAANEKLQAVREKLKDSKAVLDSDLPYATKFETGEQDPWMSVHPFGLVPDGPLTAFLLLHMSTAEGKKWLDEKLKREPITLNTKGEKIVNTRYLRKYFRETDDKHGFFVNNQGQLSVDEVFGNYEIEEDLKLKTAPADQKLILDQLINRVETNWTEDAQLFQLELLRRIASEYDGSKTADQVLINKIKETSGQWVDLVNLKESIALQDSSKKVLKSDAPYYLYLAKWACGIENPGAYHFLYQKKEDKEYVYALEKGSQNIIKYEIVGSKFIVQSSSTDTISAVSEAMQLTPEALKQTHDYNLALDAIKQIVAKNQNAETIPDGIALALTENLKIDLPPFAKKDFDQQKGNLAKMYLLQLGTDFLKNEISDEGKRKSYVDYITQKSAELRFKELKTELEKSDDFKNTPDDIKMNLKAENGVYKVFVAGKEIGKIEELKKKMQENAVLQDTLAKVNEAKQSIWGKLALMIFGKDEFEEMVKDGSFASFFTFLGFLGPKVKESLEETLSGIMDKLSPGTDISQAAEVLHAAVNEPLSADTKVAETLIPKDHRLLVPVDNALVKTVTYKEGGIFAMFSSPERLDPSKAIDVNGTKYCEVPEGATLMAGTLPKGTRLERMNKEAAEKKNKS